MKAHTDTTSQIMADTNTQQCVSVSKEQDWSYNMKQGDLDHDYTQQTAISYDKEYSAATKQNSNKISSYNKESSTLDAYNYKGDSETKASKSREDESEWRYGYRLTLRENSASKSSDGKESSVPKEIIKRKRKKKLTLYSTIEDDKSS